MNEVENYKQFSEDLASGKNLLLDYNNNEIECTKLGVKKPKYSRSITGQSSFKERFKKGFVNKIQYGPMQYLPVSNRFIGSPMCPRPLSIPFYNQEDTKEKSLLEEIRKEALYNMSKNKQVFSMKSKKDNLPSFFCSRLAVDSPKNKKRLIQLFDSEIDDRKKKYRYQVKYYKKDPIFRGLSHQKSCMENNLTKDLFNGEKVPFTTQKDINIKYKVVKRLIMKNGYNKMHIDKKEANREEYNKIYKIKRIKEMTKQDFFNRSNLTNTNLSMNDKFYSENNTKYKNLKIIQSISAQRNNLINMKQKSRQKIVNNNLDSSIANSNDAKGAYFQNTLNKSFKFNSTVTTCYNYNIENNLTNNLTNNESKISKNIQTNKNELYTPKSLHKLKRALSDFQMSIANKFNMKEDEMYFNNISDITEKNEKIRNLKEMAECCEHETELLKGFQSPINLEINEESKKTKPPNYISPLTVYKKEYEMFLKVNPIECEKEKKRRIFDEKLLKKKMQNKKIFERIKFKK